MTKGQNQPQAGRLNLIHDSLAEVVRFISRSFSGLGNAIAKSNGGVAAYSTDKFQHLLGNCPS